MGPSGDVSGATAPLKGPERRVAPLVPNKVLEGPGTPPQRESRAHRAGSRQRTLPGSEARSPVGSLQRPPGAPKVYETSGLPAQFVVIIAVQPGALSQNGRSAHSGSSMLMFAFMLSCRTDQPSSVQSVQQ